MDERGVTFRTKDGRAITVDGPELLARFVQHVLPPHFVNIRHYGLHAASNATTRLACAREILAPLAPRPPHAPDHDWRALLLRVTGVDVRACRACKRAS